MKSDVSSCSTEHPTCVMPAPIPRLEASPDVEEQRLVVYLPADASGTCSTGRYAGPQSSKTRDVERCAPRGARLCQREDESTCPTAPFCPTGLLQPVLCQTGRTTKNDEISNRDEGFHILGDGALLVLWRTSHSAPFFRDKSGRANSASQTRECGRKT